MAVARARCHDIILSCSVFFLQMTKAAAFTAKREMMETVIMFISVWTAVF